MTVLSFLPGAKGKYTQQTCKLPLAPQGVTADSSLQAEHRCEDCTTFEGWVSNLGFHQNHMKGQERLGISHSEGLGWGSRMFI